MNPEFSRNLAAILSDHDNQALMLLLKICSEKDNAPMSDELASAIASSSLYVTSVTSVANTSTKDVAPNYFATHWPMDSSPSNTDLLTHVSCHIAPFSGFNEIELFIIDSEDGATKQKLSMCGYDDLPRTQRYYNACSSSASTSKLQYFVYIACEEDATTDNNFINISNYELRDELLSPLFDIIEEKRTLLIDVQTDLEDMDL